MKVHRGFLRVLTWSLGSSFFLLSVPSVPYVVWQDVLLRLWLETLFHMCSQNPAPSAMPPLLADNTSQFLTNIQLPSSNTLLCTSSSCKVVVTRIIFPIHSKQSKRKDLWESVRRKEEKLRNRERTC